MVDARGGLRLPFSSLVPALATGGAVPITLKRGGRPVEAGMEVTREDDRLIRPYSGRYPAYFVHGPLVFSPAAADAIPAYAEGNPPAMPGSPLVTCAGDRVAFPGEELVVVASPILPHAMARGYQDPFGQVVKDVDGIPVRNLAHLIGLLRDVTGEHLTIRFFGELSETLVFSRREMEAATAGLLEENGIPRRGTEDALAAWGGGPDASR
ncbi:hypothetical protein EP7_002384 [Isosphaeraceae bacterium EP7]